MPFINSVRSTYGFDQKFKRRQGVLGRSSSNPASNATAIINEDPTSPDGLYWINLGNGQGIQQVYCILNSSIDGGGWMVLWSGPSGSTSSGNRYTQNNDTINATPLTNFYSLSYSKRSGVRAIASESKTLFYSGGSNWLRANASLWPYTNHNSGNFRFETNTSCITSNGTTDNEIMIGATNYDVAGGGDMGITAYYNGFDHHSNGYYLLNCGCGQSGIGGGGCGPSPMYLYNYGAGYKVNTGLSGWNVQGSGCSSENNNEIAFLVAIK